MFAGNHWPFRDRQWPGTLLPGVLLILLFSISVRAQSTFGSVRGTVTDANGAALSNATVKVTNEGQSVTRAAASNRSQRGWHFDRQRAQQRSAA